MDQVDQILSQLEILSREGRFVELESDWLEIKPVPAERTQWKRIHESVNAFLNTRGGVVILGVKEEQNPRRYVITGWREHAENNLKELATTFTDRAGVKQDLTDCFPPMQIRDVPGGGKVCVVYIDELAADKKYVFLEGKAFKRHLTADTKLGEVEIETQEQFKEEAKVARELRPVAGLTFADLDLTKLNQFIYQLNQPTAVETIKSDMEQARAFLERRSFIKGNTVTILGALVCAAHPGDCLGFRSHVHGYVDITAGAQFSEPGGRVVQDKQDFVDNVLQLMEAGINYLLRNIQVAISPQYAGVSQPQYPSTLLREVVNNALAHRDYTLDRQVILAIKPGKFISIQNPGTFRPQQLIEESDHEIPLHRVLPEARPRNPKLADVLRVFKKWEGRGIGMATLVNICLQDATDVPYYRLQSDEVRLHVCAGRLLDERMIRLFEAFDGYIEEKHEGNSLTQNEKLVLSYIIKSEWHNQNLNYTILLTPDNNHFEVIRGLERSNLISKHPRSKPQSPVYIADRVLVGLDYSKALLEFFGSTFTGLRPALKQLLGVVYRFEKYSKAKSVSAKQAAYVVWYETEAEGGIEQFDAHYRKVRSMFNKLLKLGYVKQKRSSKRLTYQLNERYKSGHLPMDT